MMKTVSIRRDRILAPCSLEGMRYQVDPYSGCEHDCAYCYAQNDVDVDWRREVGIIPDLAARLDQELARLEPQAVYLGMNTDPYQPQEADLGQTRAVLETLLGRGMSACVLTKSDMVIRDIDIYTKMPGSSVGTSMAFQRERDRQAFEACPSRPQRRAQGDRAFKRASLLERAARRPGGTQGIQRPGPGANVLKSPLNRESCYILPLRQPNRRFYV
jgi:DNA repair photolyase